MTRKDIELKQEELLNRLKALSLMSKANLRASQANLKRLQDLNDSGRFDPEELLACCAETERLKRVSALNKKMTDDAVSEARQFFVGLYGPSGGILFDALLKELEDS